MSYYFFFLILRGITLSILGVTLSCQRLAALQQLESAYTGLVKVKFPVNLY